MTEDSLDVILEHPEVEKRLDLREGEARRMLSGLAGKRRKDCAIGVVREVVERLEEADALPEDLRKMYDCLRNDVEYKRYFMEDGSGEPLGSKNDANKAIKGY